MINLVELRYSDDKTCLSFACGICIPSVLARRYQRNSAVCCCYFSMFAVETSYHVISELAMFMFDLASTSETYRLSDLCNLIVAQGKVSDD